MENTNVVRLPPYKFLHVLDTNTNVSRTLCGPLTYTKQDHEKFVSEIMDMIVIPHQHFVLIGNPVVLKKSKKDDKDMDKTHLEPYRQSNGQVQLRHGMQEIRLYNDFPEPFPLYPGEYQIGKIEKLRIVEVNSALRIRAIQDFVSDDGEEHAAGDEWLFKGPATYIPRIEESIVVVVRATILKFNQALKLRARKSCTDSTGIKRSAGEEWLVRTCGAYLPEIDEEIIETRDAQIVTDKKALHLLATRTFKDNYNIQRKAGEEWLVTSEMTETHVQDVYEEIIGPVHITTLTNRQYCIVLDPYIDGICRLGKRILRKGECSFFLYPGEQLENGIQDICVLGEDEALLLQCTEKFEDQDSKESILREPGDRWMVYGPREYIPPIQVRCIETRKAIPLDENEGVYVRNTKTGEVRAVSGQTYMLQPTEELWEKILPEEVEELLEQQKATTYMTEERAIRSIITSSRDKTRVVTFRVTHNAAIQVYDYKTKASRILFGPTLVMLGPEEQFTILQLSGDVPKRPKVIKTLCLQLGPDFMRDQITVETSDHARLQLTISYNWHFDVPELTQEVASKIFNVRDFVGDACKTLASRIRGAVAIQTFDNFHKHSAKIIRGSVFGVSPDGKVGSCFRFDANNLCITNVDIQTVEPVDPRTRESLQKSVQLAIEITTKSQEARAKSEAMKDEESAKGSLERQQIENQSQAEKSRKALLELQSESASVEAQGIAKARAIAEAEAAQIEGASAVRKAKLTADAKKIEFESRMYQLKQEQDAELAHRKNVLSLELQQAKTLAEIEVMKCQQMIQSIGASTIADIARAGPEMQVKLLQSLGLQGYLITDGKNPINLFQTANGLTTSTTNAIPNPMVNSAVHCHENENKLDSNE